MVNSRVGVLNLANTNTRPLLSSIQKLGYQVVDISESEQISNCDKIILPGVGNIEKVLKDLDDRNFREKLQNHIRHGKFILGICLGLQILTLHSEESVSATTLGVLPVQVSRLIPNKNKGIKVPHIGWNQVQQKSESPIFDGLSNGSNFFFSHSYAVYLIDENALGVTEHDKNFVSIINYENIFGFQFHPEKSQKNGMQILKNFCSL